MKNLFFLLLIAVTVSCSKANEKKYTGSTPATAAVVRNFFNIPLTDSVDFIRWQLTLDDNEYHLQANYGIGKPNTNGFINGGKNISLSGTFTKDKNILILKNAGNSLKMAWLNDNLLHLANDDNSLLNGTGGWSYTLNSLAPVSTTQINFLARPAALKDSMSYQGRTPCNVPGLALRDECYKIKWWIIFYADPATHEPSTYKLFGTNWRKEGNKVGSWKIVNEKNGRIIYQVNNDDGSPFIRLLKIDDQILLFTDADGKVPVGNLDFSYTLNRTW